MSIKHLLWIAFLWLSGASSALAQGTSAGFTGYVQDAKTSEVLPGATVQVRNESTGFTAGTVTDITGKFLLRELPVGGPYTLTINVVGMSPVVRKGFTLNLSDMIQTGRIGLSDGETMLNEIVVKANEFKSDRMRLGQARKIDGQTLNRIPTATRNYQSLASLSPLSRGNIGAGSKGGMTGYLLDGVSNRRNVFGDVVDGAFPVSMEAIREFEVANNAYDVTNGRGGGSVIKAITKSGTNEFHGSVFGFYAAQALTGDQFLRDETGSLVTKTGDFDVNQFGFSLGGPIVKDKAHFFITADRYSIVSPYSVDDFDVSGATLAEAEKNLSITKANMDEIVNILQSPTFNVPIPSHGKQYGTIQAPNTTANVLARIDWQLNPKHQFTLRYNYHTFYNPRKRKGLLSTQYEERSYDHSVLASLRSQLAPTVRNDLRLSYANVVRPNTLIFNRAPVGRVNVTSRFADNSSRTRQVYWGNQYWIPEHIAETNYQLINNTSFQFGKNFLTVGADVILNQINDNLTHYQQGEFFYEGIENLRANKPYRYERKTPVNGAGGFKRPRIWDMGLYAQLERDLTPRLNMVAGLRWDATYIPKKPTYNPTLDQELGIRTDVAPFDPTGIQPRLNLSWDMSGDGKNIVKFGAGMFVSQFTTQVVTFSHIDNGVDFKTVVVDKNLPGFTEADLPPANWPGYFQDFEKNVPGQAYIDQLVKSGKFTEPPATVITLDPNLKTPKTWKFNLNYYRYLTDWLNVGGGFYYNRTQGNYLIENRNLRDKPAFTLPNEGNREVYVPLDQVIKNGREAPYDLARKSTKFTQVLQFTNANWAATFWAFVVEANAKIRDGQLNLSYTRGQSRGNPRYNAGNTNELHTVGQSYQNWGRDVANWADGEDLKHKVVVSGVSPTFWGFTFSTNLIAQQAERFTAGIGGNRDIMGINLQDPALNTLLPFVFDPNSSNLTEPMRTSMRTLLETTSPEYRAYLEKYMGTFAGYNGGLQPWRYNWDVSLVKQFRIFGKQRIELRADVFNFANLLNSEWGGFNEIYNPNLYNSVDKFDAATTSWVYTINKDAGKKRYRVPNPYQVQLGAKCVF